MAGVFYCASCLFCLCSRLQTMLLHDLVSVCRRGPAYSAVCTGRLSCPFWKDVELPLKIKFLRSLFIRRLCKLVLGPNLISITTNPWNNRRVSICTVIFKHCFLLPLHAGLPASASIKSWFQPRSLWTDLPHGSTSAASSLTQSHCYGCTINPKLSHIQTLPLCAH